jgi:acyl-CoA hydrolase
MSSTTDVAVIEECLEPGMRVAIADGAGAPVALLGALTSAAERVGDLSLVLGWCLELPVSLSSSAFSDVRTLMGGFALRDSIRKGRVRYVPERLSATPALLGGALKPDVLVLAMPSGGEGQWGCEVSWMQSVTDAGAKLVVQRNRDLPRTSRERDFVLPDSAVVVDAPRAPFSASAARSDRWTETIADFVAPLVRAEADVQYGPGPVADAVLSRLDVPVHVRSGIVSDSVMHLERRGLLLSEPVGAYVFGTPELYAWADGRAITTRLEITHQPRSDTGPVVTINAAAEIDWTGQVGVQQVDGRHVSGVGGLPDFAVSGHRSVGGLSIITTPTMRGSRSTLVERLSGPVSVPTYDIDVVATEKGLVDFRGLDIDERARALKAVWSR